MEYSLLKKALQAGACVVVLTGCSWLEEWDGRQAKAPQPQPQAKLMQTADATWIKPEENQKPVEKLVPAPDETMLETRTRLNDMEKQLADMQNDMKMIMPALTRLAALPVNSGDMSQVQPSAGSDAAAVVDDGADLMPVPLVQQPVKQPVTMAAASAAPVPARESAPPAASMQPASYSSGVVAQDIRFGSHPDKTRVVIDVSGEIGFTYDIDNTENILLIDLAGTQWGGAAQAPVGDSPLVTSYEAVPNGKGGTQMAVQLRQPAKVLWAQTLPAVGGKGPRLVIDIAPQ